MKKYNTLIIFSIVLWLVIAIITGLCIRHLETRQNTKYKVEINRLYYSLSGELNPDKLNLHSCKWVEQIRVLSAMELTNEEKVTTFYESDNDLDTEICPIYKDNELQGFVRFDYKRPITNVFELFWIVESILLIIEIFLLIILFYIKSKVLMPFRRMSQMPYELARGHLKGIVKEDKNKFFGHFLLGLGQLKNTLDVSKKRTLQLEKEKKTLLLSLSHDIKTPLNNIKLYAKALEEDIYTEKQEKHHAAHQIGEKTKEIERYVEEIMKHSREEILDIQVHNTQFYLNDLMNKVLDTYKEKCSIRLVELIMHSYDNRLLKGDIDRTLEVFENIFENAFKYGDGRIIEISFTEEDDCQLIRIFNTGEPVSESDFNHIFESFFRAANSEGQPGNGLGLYICREIMRKMGGTIFAERTEDGMAFVLVFE